MTATKLFLNGDFKSSSDGKAIPQTNPATEQIFCEVSAEGWRTGLGGTANLVVLGGNLPPSFGREIIRTE